MKKGNINSDGATKNDPLALERLIQLNNQNGPGFVEACYLKVLEEREYRDMSEIERKHFKECLIAIQGTQWESFVTENKPYKTWAREMDERYFDGQKHFQLGEFA